MQSMAKSVNNDDLLVLSIDFAQDKLLPMFNKEQPADIYFMQKQKVALFSITEENTGNHHIYPITELEILNYKKGQNFVCSLIYHFLTEIKKPKTYKKIILFADNCGGQNKNNCVF